MSSPTLIDDSNPVVQYAPGWIWDQLVNEVDHTRHGAALAPLTASLGFSGSGIQVVGTLEPTDQDGRPTTTYTIDGNLVEIYTAPFTASGDTHYNVTFFSKLDLNFGNHELVINNTNGTSPNTFWLDYFLIYTEPVSAGSTTTSSNSPSVTPSRSLSSTLVPTVHIPFVSTSASTSSPVATSASPSSSLSSLSLSSTFAADSTTDSFSISGTASSAAATVTSSTTGTGAGTSQSSRRSNTGAIVGGVIGGLVILFLLALLLRFRLRRKPKAQDDIQPFAPQTREHTSYSGTLVSGGATAVNAVKVPELALASTTAVTSITSVYPETTSSNRASTSPSEDNGSNVSNLNRDPPAAAEGHGHGRSPISAGSLSPAESKLQESIYGRLASNGSAPRRSSPSPSDQPTTPAPADVEASRAPWYAPAQGQSRAQALLHVLSLRRQPRRPHHDEDSGLRLYNEATLPPPYTAE